MCFTDVFAKPMLSPQRFACFQCWTIIFSNFHDARSSKTTIQSNVSFKIDWMPQLFCKLRFVLQIAIVNAMSKKNASKHLMKLTFSDGTKFIFQWCTLQKHCKVCQFCFASLNLYFFYGPLFFLSVTLQNWSNASANSLGFENCCFVLCFTIVNAMCTFSFFKN